MGGRYITCGSFEGDDKSISPISSVLAVVFERSTGRPPRVSRPTGFVAWLRRLTRRRQAPSFELDFETFLGHLDYESAVVIPSTLVESLIPLVQKYHDDLGRRLGHPDYDLAREIDRDRGLDMTKVKWGNVIGEGWHYLCCRDLLRGLKAGLKTGQPIRITSD